ncbi:MAG TPA: DUF4190 domain-containing protein [Candidatus Acidoferrales bacterium]|nr:DUF4190 domain-containing protein [Candidatus Acidoferrales bacterium]
MSSFCLGCGNSLAEGERYCEVCGRDSQTNPATPAVDPAVAFGLPPETSGKAIFSLVSGILFLVLPFSVCAVIFGHLSLYDIRKSAGRLTGRGLAIAGIILGYVGVAFFAGLIGLGIYEENKAKQMAAKNTAASGEASVISTLRDVNTAEIAYARQHQDVGYTCSLSDLKWAWRFSDDLDYSRKHGYVFELRGCMSEKKNGPVAKYTVVAYPQAVMKPGLSAFCSDQSDVIRVARNGSVEDCLRTGSQLSEEDMNRPRLRRQPH